jgi:VWFA-related protein
MNKKSLTKIGVCTAVAIAACAAVVTYQAKGAAEPAPITMTVTAVGKKDAPPPPLAKSDVELYQGKERMQVADWRKGETLLLAIVIDDSLGSNIASQWNDLKAFIMEQPATTNVGVFYGRNGTVMVAQDFTPNHELAAKALRIPLGGQGAFSSPYLELQDMIKRWPDNNERKSIILISSGIDYFRGNFGPTSPDLDPTIDRAQKSNINIWTIYAPDSGHAGRGLIRSFNAQSSLSQLSDETGAESYFLGFGQPVSLKGYFDDISTHLGNQYLLTFSSGSGGKKGRFERVRVATENPGVEFLTPSEVFIPKAE